MKSLQLFVSCADGLEPLLAEELAAMGITNVSPEYCGVAIDNASMETVYRINYNSRLASRVLLSVYQFRCWDRTSLYDAAREIDWGQLLSVRDTFVVDANVTHPELRNSLFAALVVKDAICDHFRDIGKERPSVDKENPTIRFNLFIQGKNGILSVDTSGEPLHKRGYRVASTPAPIRESLAAALLYLANYKGTEEIVYDPCCGSGTLLIEAALMAAKIPPGYLRRNWGFMKLPLFSQKEWLQVRAEADQHRTEVPKGRFFGTDVDREAISACRANLKASGLLSSIEILRKDFRELEPQIAPTFLITNPPHGNRLEEIDSVRPLYRALGDFMKRKMAKPSHGFIFVPYGELTKEIGLAAKRKHVLTNGGVESRLLCFDLWN